MVVEGAEGAFFPLRLLPASPSLSSSLTRTNERAGETAGRGAAPGTGVEGGAGTAAPGPGRGRESPRGFRRSIGRRGDSDATPDRRAPIVQARWPPRRRPRKLNGGPAERAIARARGRGAARGRALLLRAWVRVWGRRGSSTASARGVATARTTGRLGDAPLVVVAIGGGGGKGGGGGREGREPEPVRDHAVVVVIVLSEQCRGRGAMRAARSSGVVWFSCNNP